MNTPLSDMLGDIIETICKSSEFDMSLNKTKVYNEVVDRLEEIDYMPRTPGFIRNMLTGEQGAGKATRRTIARLHSQLTKPKRKRYRLEMDCSDEEMAEMQKETDLRARALKQLGNLKTEI